jgi:uncharacterized protein (TIGR02145 family)
MKQAKKYFLILVLLFCAEKSFTQLGISSTNTQPNPSAMLDVSSTSKGILIPRMNSTERTGIATPAQGLTVFDTQTKTFWYFDGVTWREMDTSTLATLPYYPSVTICCQSWMTKNLDVTTYRNGDSIPQVTDPTAWASLTTGAWCYFNNTAANGPIYGKLYNWYAVNDPRGLAPEGWHVPTDFEWTTLVNCVGGESTAGNLLKEFGTTHWSFPNMGATNLSGFRALPGVNREADGSFFLSAIGYTGKWWSASLVANTAWYRNLSSEFSTMARVSASPIYGFSVRCMKD